MTAKTTISIIKVIIQAVIALPHPILWRDLIIHHCRMHPMQGIIITIAMKNAVTTVSPKSLFLPFTKPSAIPRKIAFMTSDMTARSTR